MRVMGMLSRVWACLAVGLSLVSCGSVGPAERIAQNPVLFQSLPAQQQVLVRQGLLCEGMSREAVLLAWGSPSAAPVLGQEGGRRYERWVYTSLRPVMMPGGGYHAWGCYGCCDAWGRTAYVPEERASVTFEEGRVTRWECRR